MIYRAIIFDLDGTLLDTLKDLAFSVNAVLQEKGYNEHPVDAYRFFVGDGIETLVRRAFPDDKADDLDFPELVKAVKEEYRKRWADHTLPYPGIKEMLDYFEGSGIPKAIFSNKPHEFTTLTVDKLLSRWHFAVVQGIEDGVPKKPDPAGALKVASIMGVKPEEIVYLGDTATDMKTAVTGNFFPVGALWGFRPADELMEAGASMLAEKPQDLMTLFDKTEHVNNN